MYNHLLGHIHYKGYEIAVRYSDINGMYQLSTMVEAMGEEYREAMTSDVNPMEDQTITERFIQRIEHNK